jgi:hypothetical protein
MLILVYYQREDVVTAIHAQTKTTKWVECDDDVYNALTGDKSAPSYLVSRYESFVQTLNRVTGLVVTTFT